MVAHFQTANHHMRALMHMLLNIHELHEADVSDWPGTGVQ